MPVSSTILRTEGVVPEGGRGALEREQAGERPAGPGQVPRPAPLRRRGPRSRTSTSSKASRETRRCVTSSVARPSPARTISRITSRSVRASRWAVGSSRRRNGASLEAAPARGRGAAARLPRGAAPARRSRCRAPPGSRATRPSRRTVDEDGAQLRVGRHRARRGRGSRVACPVKRCARWAAKAIARAHARRTEQARASRPSRSRLPGGTSQKRRSRWTRVDLPEPLGPTTATRRPGSRRRLTPSSAACGSPG